MTDAISRLNTALEGRYRIDGGLGEGGMATVYLADDLRHERKVALKVLKPELAAVVGAERFLSEIKTTANLQHPHILPLHDSGEADGFLFYVMPFIEGETLRDRLDREKQLPVGEAVRIATDVAEALHAAHEQGVIHRDIKPANILLSRGRPLVADFGIALAVTTAGGGRMTETGLSLGTPHYMSPEQATGDPTIGPTTDVYALGCVLYEMLVGHPPYTGSTAQAILGKIIAGEPASATKQRGSVPPHLDAAIRRALEKLPADRFVSAEAFGRALMDRAFRHGVDAVGQGGRLSAGEGRWRRRALAATGAAAVLAVVAAWGSLRPEAGTAPQPAMLSALLFPTDSGPQGSFALSPDGSRLAFVSDPRLDGGRIWVRQMATLQQRPLEDTEQASALAWSHDGTRIAFRGRGMTRVVPADGGPVVTAVEGSSGLPNWTLDDRILYGRGGTIWSVSAGGGGTPTPIVEVSGGALGASGLFEEIPDGKAFLMGGGGGDGTGSGIYLVDAATGQAELLIEGAYQPHYVDGWLVFLGPGKDAMAQRFDPAKLELVGGRVTLATGIPTPGGRARLSVAGRTLVYQVSPEGGDESLVWGDPATGNLERLDPNRESEGWLHDLSHDGSMIASGGWGLWVTESESGLPRRLEGAGDRAFAPRWSPNDSTILFLGVRGLELIGLAPGDSAIVVVPAGGGQISEPGWGPNGEILYLLGRGDGRDLQEMVLGGEPRTVHTGVRDPVLSPDGRWLAYASLQGGDEPNVFVRAYDGTDVIRVSGAEGGVHAGVVAGRGRPVLRFVQA